MKEYNTTISLKEGADINEIQATLGSLNFPERFVFKNGFVGGGTRGDLSVPAILNEGNMNEFRLLAFEEANGKVQAMSDLTADEIKDRLGKFENADIDKIKKIFEGSELDLSDVRKSHVAGIKQGENSNNIGRG